MKILLIYRRTISNQTSIEHLFDGLFDKTKFKDVELTKYTLSGYSKIFKDIYNIRKLNPDVFHITGGCNHIAAFLPPSKTLITVHDIGHYLYGLNGVKRFIYKIFFCSIPFFIARKISVISENTKTDLITHFKFCENKIKLIPNSYNKIFNIPTKHFNSKKPKILQVGTKPYKNVERLIKSIKGLDIILILIGKLSAEQLDLLKMNSVEFENYYNIELIKLAELYKSADICTFISIGEGFGVPIIEAQASGTPLITSNIPPMSDVAGLGAVKVSPFDLSDIRNGIVNLIENESLRTNLIELGYENSKKYSDDNIREQYLNFYRS
jgi:glycosyltransferase involved in cell wall biosynthesis